jgi:peptidoglycan/xylan/chitin deacetylase (PgdA/CDA1 family)
MRFVSPLLKHVVYPLLSRGGYFRRISARGGLSVITYHGILPEGYRSSDSVLDGNLISAQSFRRQLRWLKANYHVISPQDLLTWLEHGGQLAPRSVLLTCDDGLLNTLTDMLPILREEGVSCLFFATGLSAGEVPRMLWYEELYRLLMSGHSGPVVFETLGIRADLGTLSQRRAFWLECVQALSRCSPDERDTIIQTARPQLGLTDAWQDTMTNDGACRRRFFLLTRSELKQLAASGMCIGAHTMTHPVLSQQSSEAASAEIQECRRTLENALGTRVWALAYPFGDPSSVTPRDIQLAERAGFQCAFLNFGGGFGAALPHFAIPRVHVTAGMTLAEFDAHVSGFYQAFRGRRMADQRLFTANTQRTSA